MRLVTTAALTRDAATGFSASLQMSTHVLLYRGASGETGKSAVPPSLVSYDVNHSPSTNRGSPSRPFRLGVFKAVEGRSVARDTRGEALLSHRFRRGIVLAVFGRDMCWPALPFILERKYDFCDLKLALICFIVSLFFV
jgi:hypothetical protein